MSTDQVVALVSSTAAVFISIGGLFVSILSFRRSGPRISIRPVAEVEGANKTVASWARVGASVVNGGQAAIQITRVGYVVHIRKYRFIGWRYRGADSFGVKDGPTRLEGFHAKSFVFPAPVLTVVLYHHKGKDARVRVFMEVGSGRTITSRPVRVPGHALSDGFSSQLERARRRRVPRFRSLKIWIMARLPVGVAAKFGVPARYRNRNRWRDWRLDRVAFLSPPMERPDHVELADG